jgi:hypothetical protein
VETCHGRGNGGTHEELYFGEGRVILRKKKGIVETSVFNEVKSDGTIDKCKTRLIAKGYIYIYIIDYKKVFVLVAKMNTISFGFSHIVNLN